MRRVPNAMDPSTVVVGGAGGSSEQGTNYYQENIYDEEATLALEVSCVRKSDAFPPLLSSCSGSLQLLTIVFARCARAGLLVAPASVDRLYFDCIWCIDHDGEG